MKVMVERDIDAGNAALEYKQETVLQTTDGENEVDLEDFTLAQAKEFVREFSEAFIRLYERKR